MSVIKIKELIGTSPESFEDALNQVIKQAAAQHKNVSGARIIGQSIDVNDNQIVEYKVNVKVAYKWEKELNK
jgi:hypothetical protein